MDEGGKQLGAIVIAVVVVLALVLIARAVFGADGQVQDKIEEELNKITSYVEPIELDEVQSVIEVIC